jgi:hypothetical protein
METVAPGEGARQRHQQLVAARLRRLKAEGATDAELVHALDEETRSERSWRVGAEGEEQVGGLLNEWSELCGFAVLHDLVIPNAGGANIDHIAIGLGGVTVIDVKKWEGDVQVKANGVWIGRYGHRKALDGIAKQVAEVKMTLARADLASVPVRGVLCLANENRGCPRGELLTVGSIAVGDPRTIATLAASDAGCGCASVEAAFAALAAVYEPKAGARPPADLLVGASAPQTRMAPGKARRPRRTPASAASGIAVPKRSTPPVARSGSRDRPRTPPRRRKTRAKRGLKGDAIRFVVVLVMLSAVYHGLNGSTASSRVLVGPDTVTSWAPALRDRAAAAAGGPVSSPVVKMTADRAHLRYRRHNCRIRLSINRRTARSPQDAVVVAQGRCPASRT